MTLLRRLLVLSIVLAAGLFAASCLSQQELNRQFYGYFLRDVKTMQDMELPVYWLGNGFTANGLAFQGPYGSGDEVEGGGAQVGYSAWLATPFAGSNPSLDITVYSPAAWERVKQGILNLPLPGVPSRYKVTKREVNIQGQQAQLITHPAGDLPAHRINVVLTFDSVVVRAEVDDIVTSDRALDAQLNVFINNPDLLVQVMQNLRPYPQ